MNCPVKSIEQLQNGWRVESGDAEAPSEFDAVIVASPISAAAKIVESVDQQMANELDSIHHASCSIVSLGFKRSQIAHPLNGFGAIVPRIENRKILSASFSSIKYAGRAAEDDVLIRVFVGGDFQAELARLPDDELVRTAVGDLRGLLDITGEPVLTQISRRLNAMPQYFIGHIDRVAGIRERLAGHAGLHLAGNALEGVGIPHCIRSGEQAAETLAKEYE